MKIRVTALAGQGDFGPLMGLPLGGDVPEGTTRTFTLQHTADFDRVRPALVAAQNAGKITYTISAEETDDGRVYIRRLRIQHTDLTAAAVNQTIVDPIGALPEGARLLWYRRQTDVLFSGGGAGSASLDSGFNVGPDTLDDGRDVFTGAATGESFGGGDNSSIKPRDISGLVLQGKITANVNVVLLTAGDITLELAYTV